MRVFLAVHPGEEFCVALSTRIDPWRDRIPVKWTRPATWHLTLQFLGEWPAAPLAALQERLDALSCPPRWELRPGLLGAFPDLRRPRVLFLQLVDDGRIAELTDLVRGAVAAAWPDGPQDTKPMRPHLTLARVKAPLERTQVNALGDIDLGGLPDLPVTGFALVASQLLPEGAQYRNVAFWGLRKKGE